MQIRLAKQKDKQIGALRIDTDVFSKIDELAKRHKVSRQVIARAILEKAVLDPELEITN